MQDAKEEVRARLNIEDVIGEYVRLTRAGRSLKGLSPFSQEKTPSFMVSPEKHVWYDFSSNQGGDVFSFVMMMEGVDFKEALELLARRAGVDLSLYQQGSKDLSQKKQRLIALLALATRYYQQTLPKNPRALEYVVQTRDLNKKVIHIFQIGFAPETPSAAVEFLEKKGYSRSEIKDAGLTNQRGGDLFRSRIMIPLKDVSGQVIGFTGRLLGDIPNAPKYLNTPGTLLYDKSRHVFGLELAKDAIRQADLAVLVEGNLDVVSSHQIGIINVVAAAGTALTEQHLKTIKRFSSRVALAFDSDKAGLAATERAIDLAEAAGVELSVISLPPGAKDPDELIKQNPDTWRQAIASAQPAVDWVLEQYAARYDVTTAGGKRQFTSASLAVINKLSDPVEQEHYLALIATKSNSSLEAVSQKFETLPGKAAPEKLKQTAPSPQAVDSKYANEDALTSLALFYPAARPLLVELDETELSSEGARSVVTYLKTNPAMDFSSNLPTSLQPQETYVKIALLRAEARYAAWNDLDRYDEAARLVRLIKNDSTRRQKQDLMQQLRQAELAGDEPLEAQLKQQLSVLIKEVAQSDKPTPNR